MSDAEAKDSMDTEATQDTPQVEPTEEAAAEEQSGVEAEKTEPEANAVEDDTSKQEEETPKKEEEEEPQPPKDEEQQKDEGKPAEESEEAKPEEPKTEDSPQETTQEEATTKEDAPTSDAPAEEKPAEAPPVENGEEAAEKAAPVRPPRTRVRTSDPSQPPNIAYTASGLGAVEAITIGELFKQTKGKYTNHPALAYKDGDEWKKISYGDYYDLTIRAAKSFLKLELEPMHGVAIIGFNSVEWFIANFGAIFAGGFSCGVYATNKPEVCQYIANDCQANIAVVEDKKQLDKFLQIRKDLPNLKAIVQYKGEVSAEHSAQDVYDWEQFLKLGDSLSNDLVEEKISKQKPEDCAALIYTSGTTGNPKGVMLSHDNITWNVKSMEKMYGIFTPGAERGVSYLPLSHIAAQIADMYFPLQSGGTCYFAKPDALKGSLKDTIFEVKPTLFFAVPRVWEKLMAGIKAQAPTGGLKKVLGNWAKSKGTQGNLNVQKGQSMPFGWTIAKRIVGKARVKLGLEHCKIYATSAAPITLDVLQYFTSINMPIMELWGMSEGSGPIVGNVYESGRWCEGSVGKPYPGVEVELKNKTADGEGEVCYRGRCVMMGYLHQEEKTIEAIDEEGWLHSGDLGKFNEQGFLYITGRIKELIITSGGENVAPVPIEDRIKKQVPFLSNVMVVGDHRNYLTCLVTMKVVTDAETGEPTDDLSAEAIEHISSRGSPATKVSQIIDNQDRAVFTAIQEGIDKANEAAVSNAQTVKKWSLLDNDFSVSSGELGPTLKLKRFYVQEKFKETIGGLYATTQ